MKETTASTPGAILPAVRLHTAAFLWALGCLCLEMCILQDLGTPSRSIKPTFACLAIELECEAHGAAAVHSGGGVLTGAVAAAVVHRARFCNHTELRVPREITAAPRNIMGHKAQSQHTAFQAFSPEHTNNC